MLRKLQKSYKCRKNEKSAVRSQLKGNAFKRFFIDTKKIKCYYYNEKF